MMKRDVLQLEVKDGHRGDTRATMAHLVCGFGELKFAEGDDETMSFSGYGAVFGNVDAYGDVIQKGAFRDTIREAKRSGNWPSMLAQHGGWGVTADDMMPIGVWTSMAEDEVGLKVDGQLAKTQRGRDAYTLLKMQPRPALNGLSIGYIPKKWSQRTKPEEPRRTLEAVELLEVSLVTFPANPKARVADVKSAEGLTIRDAEKALRDAGFSRSEAMAIVVRGFKGLTSGALRDAGGSDGEIAGLVAALERNASILRNT